MSEVSALFLEAGTLLSPQLLTTCESLVPSAGAAPLTTEPGTPGGPAGPASPCVEMTSISTLCAFRPILPLSPALGGSRLFAPAHGATPFAALSHGCWHRAWPHSLLATVTNILCLVLISPSRREETGPALRARPVQSLDLVGLPWPLLCPRTALGPLLSVHLAVPGAAPDVPGMTGTRRGGEALPPGPQRAGSASNKRASSKHAHELCGGSQPFPTGRDTRASSACPSPPPPGRLAKGDGPCQPLSGGERHPGSAQGVSASRGNRKVSTASTALTYSHNEDTP